MARLVRGELTLSDLRPVLDVVAKALEDESQIISIKDRTEGLGNVRFPSGPASSRERWTAVFKAALDERPETLALLLFNIRNDLGTRSAGELAEALDKVGSFCLSRITRTAHPELGDQAEALLEARGVENMTIAANELRQTALNVRRLLMRPILAHTCIQLAPSVLDPEQRRMDLADLAVDVVTAVDYLLSLLDTSVIKSSKLVLESEAGSERGHGPSDGDDRDRLTRRRYDARSTAVRLGQRLLAGLRSDVAQRLDD